VVIHLAALCEMHVPRKRILDGFRGVEDGWLPP